MMILFSCQFSITEWFIIIWKTAWLLFGSLYWLFWLWPFWPSIPQGNYDLLRHVISLCWLICGKFQKPFSRTFLLCINRFNHSNDKSVRFSEVFPVVTSVLRFTKQERMVLLKYICGPMRTFENGSTITLGTGVSETGEVCQSLWTIRGEIGISDKTLSRPKKWPYFA